MRIPRVPQSLPKKVSTHYHRKRNPAISPRRRRITEFGKPNSVSRSQTISSCLGRHQIGEQIDLHKLHPSTFFPKVLRSAMNPWIHWFISDRLPRSPSSRSPQRPPKYFLSRARSWTASRRCRLAIGPPKMPDCSVPPSLTTDSRSARVRATRRIRS